MYVCPAYTRDVAYNNDYVMCLIRLTRLLHDGRNVSSAICPSCYCMPWVMFRHGTARFNKRTSAIELVPYKNLYIHILQP